MPGGKSVGAVLGISLTATRAGLVVLDGVGADARTVIRDAVAVSAGGLDVVVAAVARVARTAASRGYSVQAAGLTSTADAEQQALDLAGLLADSDLADIVMFEPADAVAALADVVVSSRRSQRATVSLITEDQTIAVLADDRDGIHHTAVSQHRDDDAALVSLDQLAADGVPGAVFVMVPHDLVAEAFPERLERALAPRTIALIDAELGLARGAALAAGTAAFVGTVVGEPTVPVRQRLHRTDALLIAAVGVTVLVAVMTVVLVRGALLGGESSPHVNSSLGVADNEDQQLRQAPPPASSAVAPPVSIADEESAAMPPVSAPEQEEPHFAESGEARLRKTTEPIAESGPAPVTPPDAAPAPSPVEEPAPSPIQDAITFVEQTFGIDVDNDGLIGGRPATPAPGPDHAAPA